MSDEQMKEQLKRAAFEYTQAEVAYMKAKAHFEALFERVAGDTGKIPSRKKKTDIKSPQPGSLVSRITNALPADGSPTSLKQLSALVDADAKMVSATCSNLQKKNIVHSTSRGMWALVVKT